MPYRTTSWTLLRVRQGGPPGSWLFVVAAVGLIVICTLFLGMAVRGPEHLKSLGALVSRGALSREPLARTSSRGVHDPKHRARTA